jgi:acetyl-CoA carboxylase biotin carboxylase subunit
MNRISRILVANRGEIAARIIRACKEMGISTVLAASEADKDSLPARLADRVICIGPPPARDSYLRPEYLVTAALGTSCEAIHPGYGFLSERAELAEMCERSGVIFIGPSSKNIRDMGDKVAARETARRAGVPTIPGSEKVKDLKEAVEAGRQLGFPVMVKAAAGGGGRGMAIIETADRLEQVFASLSFEVHSAFGDATLFLERYFPNSRHVEVQIIGDHFGKAIHLFERDCSIQRRHQKVIEEAPCPFLNEKERKAICGAALHLALAIGYVSCGTVEFLVDQDTRQFFFLEMNTRIQVEHPITEEITGIDIVKEQIGIAGGRPLRFSQKGVAVKGHAIECRVNAESPDRNFAPCPGAVLTWAPPAGNGIRLETHCYPGYRIPPFYDSLIAKLIVRGKDRAEAVLATQSALRDFQIEGVETTLPFLRAVTAHPDFKASQVSTNWLEKVFMHQFRKGAG